MQIDVNNFCSSSSSEDIREKHKFQNQLDVFFITYYTYGVTQCMKHIKAHKRFDLSANFLAA